MLRSRALTVERLEDRYAPATFGNPWPDALHLSLSFAPDGTQVGDRQSNLFSALNSQLPAAVWQTAIVRAFDTWADYANINISVVGDNGLPFGTPGPIQGDSRFGDIRIASYLFSAQNGDVEDLAIGSPFETSAGTWAGDVKLNSATKFSVNGGPGYDLYTVMLHEAGHALGLDHSPSTASVMYEDYTGPKTGLSDSDIVAIQALYGVRSQDSYEGRSGNDSFASATTLLVPNSPDGNVALQADADVTTLQGKDIYRFNTLLSTGGLMISLQTTNISSLMARVTVYDSFYNVVGTAQAVNALNGNLQLQLTQVRPLSTYYVKVESGIQDVLGIGSYRLKINYLPGLTLPTSSVNSLLTNTTSTLLNDDHHTDDSPLTALNLQQLFQSADSRFDEVFKGSISDSSDVDYYRVSVPAPVTPGTPVVMTSMIWGLEANGLDPRVAVYDQNQKPVAADVLVNENHTYTLQVANATPGATYYVRVAAAQPQGSNNVGNYFLGIDFSSKAVTLNNYASGTLVQGSTQDATSVTVTHSELQHFILSADAGNTGVSAAVRMTVYDANMKVLLSVVVNAGDTISTNLFVTRGSYLIRFAAATATGVPLPALTYRLRGLTLSNPIGPEADDPTSDPYGSPSNDSYSDTVWAGGDNSGLSSQDPYSDPYCDPYSDPNSDPYAVA